MTDRDGGPKGLAIAKNAKNIIGNYIKTSGILICDCCIMGILPMTMDFPITGGTPVPQQAQVLILSLSLVGQEFSPALRIFISCHTTIFSTNQKVACF
jgi:hypothetical protein